VKKKFFGNVFWNDLKRNQFYLTAGVGFMQNN